MTARERVLTSLKRSGLPDRIPFEISWGSFTPLLMQTFRAQTGSQLTPEEYFDYDTRFVLPGASRCTTDFTGYFDGLDADASIDEWGIGCVPTKFEMPDFKYHPLAGLQSVGEIEAFPWPDLGEAYRYTTVAAQTAEYHRRGYAVCGELYQTIFETAWLMRGMENLLADFLEDTAMAHAICERITAIGVEQARCYARAGVDILRLGDDVLTQRGPMMSTATYREFLQPRLKRIVAAAKEVNPEIVIFYHTDGLVTGLVEDLIEAGMEVLNPVQPECNDLHLLKATYGDRISFWGGIGVQSVMPHGSPDEVRQAVADTAAVLGRGGGLLLAPAHILDPAVPWENIVAYVEAARQATCQ